MGGTLGRSGEVRSTKRAGAVVSGPCGPLPRLCGPFLNVRPRRSSCHKRRLYRRLPRHVPVAVTPRLPTGPARRNKDQGRTEPGAGVQLARLGVSRLSCGQSGPGAAFPANRKVMAGIMEPKLRSTAI